LDWSTGPEFPAATFGERFTEVADDWADWSTSFEAVWDWSADCDGSACDPPDWLWPAFWLWSFDCEPVEMFVADEPASALLDWSVPPLPLQPQEEPPFRIATFGARFTAVDDEPADWSTWFDAVCDWSADCD